MAIDKESTDNTVDLRTKAEAKVAVQTAANESLSDQEVKRLFHELQIHQVELEMQNEVLTRTKCDLEATRDSYFTLYDLAPVGYLTLNKDGLIQKANLTAATMLSLRTDDLINRPIQKFIFSDDIDSYYLQTRSAIEASEDFKSELRFVQSDGSPFWALLQASTQNDELFVTLTDISERKQLEESLLTANNTLKEQIAERDRATNALHENEQILIYQNRQAAMGEMIGNIAHQWRQPLNSLALLTQRLELFFGTPKFDKELLNSSVADSMKIIRHMSKTIDDFRDYFKPDKEKSEFNVREVINYTLSLLTGGFQNPKISIEIIEIDDPVINSYQNEFAQVFLNILNNARDAIIEKKIDDARVTITLRSEDRSVVVTVADNAGGIPEEIITKVFDPYFTTKGPQQGTGVGLFMSKTIIEKNMGGKLSVRNTPDGAEFRIEVEYGK